MYKDVMLNEFGFYTLKNIPTDEERETYYKEKYYKQNSKSYTTKYTKEELSFINAKLEQKHLLIQKHHDISYKKCSFIDIGCGEGFAVKFFKDKEFLVLGLDYSDEGIKNHNKDILRNVIIGDVYESIKHLVLENNKFDIVNMDNILEHVIDPQLLLSQVYKLLSTDGIVVIKVPNDFSVLQQYFHDNKIITKPHWVVSPDHISYFNREGLKNICHATGFEMLDVLGNYMTEFFVLNPNTNYLENASLGKSCHFARVAEENIFHSISPLKTIEFYRVLGEMGLGREIIGIFKKIEDICM